MLQAVNDNARQGMEPSSHCEALDLSENSVQKPTASVGGFHLSYKYKARPGKRLIEKLEHILRQDRLLYNNALQERIESYEYAQRIEWATGEKIKSITKFDQMKSLTEIRRNDEWWREGHLKRQRGPLTRLDKAFQGFFRRVKAGQTPGFPRFKGKRYWNSIEISEGWRIARNGNTGRLVSKDFPEGLPFKMHRDLPSNETATAIIKRTAKGWWVILQVELPVPEPVEGRSMVGLDMGLNAFIATSDRELIDPPKYLREAEKKLARLQKQLRKPRKGNPKKRDYRTKDSNGWKEAVCQIARLHEHVTNQRKDFHHQVASRLLERYDVIAVEDLQIRNMVRNEHLSKSITDAGWGQFIDILSYKAAKAGKAVVKVDAKGTSQVCSGCGSVVQKSLSVRVHRCPGCGLEIDRDINAAINVLKRGTVLAPHRKADAGKGCLVQKGEFSSSKIVNSATESRTCAGTGC